MRISFPWRFTSAPKSRKRLLAVIARAHGFGDNRLAFGETNPAKRTADFTCALGTGHFCNRWPSAAHL